MKMKAMNAFEAARRGRGIGWNRLTCPTQLFNSVYATANSSLSPCPHFQLQRRHLAGHNKWSKIKRKKGANDVARAKDHARAARALEVASRNCRGDRADLQLHSCLGAARVVQLPKARIERAIERGANPRLKAEGEEYLVRRYDGMISTGSSGKVAVIVDTLTENRNRTAAHVRHLVTKTGGELLPTGANDWLFAHVGVIWVAKFKVAGESGGGAERDPAASVQGTEIDMDELLECALEGGAIDVEFGPEDGTDSAEDEDVDHHALVKCETTDMLHLVQALKTEGYVTTQFETQWLVKDEGNRVCLDEESAEALEKFLTSMEEDLDVMNVFHNASVLSYRV